MSYRLFEDGGYRGMNREVAAWQLRPGEVYDAQNIIFDRPGVARHRGPTTAVFAGAQTAFAQMLAWAYFQDIGPVETLHSYEMKTGKVNSVDKTTGVTTNIATITGGVTSPLGRAIRHFGHPIFPVGGDRTATFAAGQTSATTFTNTVAAAIAANSPTVTLTGPDATTNVKIGAIVQAQSATQFYIGRVVSITDATHFIVSPVPTVAIAIPIGSLTTNPALNMYGGNCGCSWQNRLLFGNVWDISQASPLNGPVFDRRIIFSHLPGEVAGGITAFSSALSFYGNHFLNTRGWSRLNYVEVPGSDPIVALEPVNDGELLILTVGAPWVLRGQLASQTTTFAPGITYDLSPINLPADCLSDLSVQRTHNGVAWAGTDGIWLYGGGGRQPYQAGWRLPIDITEGSMHTYWRNLTRGANFAIHGSAYVRNHYILTGTSASVTFCLIYNCINGQWTTASNVDIFCGVARPTDLSQCWGARWWDVTGAAPSMTNGQVIRLESLFQPYTALSTKTDADGSTIPLSLTTRAITDEMQTQKIIRRVSVRYQLSASSAAVAVAAGSRVDPGDSGGTPTVTLGSLSSTRLRAPSAMTGAGVLIAITTVGNHGFQSGDTVDIRGVTGNTAANGRWRIVVTGVTTFTLDQSVGNGAYGAGTGTIKKITEHEFEASSMDMGQVLWLTFTGSPDDFELHGIRVGALEIPWGMAK